MQTQQMLVNKEEAVLELEKRIEDQQTISWRSHQSLTAGEAAFLDRKWVHFLH